MQNSDFDRMDGDALLDETHDRRRQQNQWIMIAGGLSLLFAAIAGVLIMRSRRRPTQLQRAEASLVAAAIAAEQAARTVRKQGPGMLARGAESVERAARTVRKQGPGMLAQGAGRAEQAARTVRKQGPPALRKGYQQTEQAVVRTRAAGAGLADSTQSLVDRVQELVHRNGAS
jgi:hypothetical protein